MPRSGSLRAARDTSADRPLEAPHLGIVTWTSTVSFGVDLLASAHLADQVVWVRVDGDEIVATHTLSLSGAGSTSPAHAVDAGSPNIDDANYPPRPAGAVARQPEPGNPAEAEFLALGDGARMWLGEAAAACTSRVKVEMANAVQLSRLHGVERVD